MYNVIVKGVTMHLQRRIIGRVKVYVNNDTLICTIISDTGIHFNTTIPNITREIMFSTSLDKISERILVKYRQHIKNLHFLY